MPYRSPKQRRYVFAKASEGQAWARRFIRHSGETPPRPRSKRSRKRRGPSNPRR